jgi:hypothetical protein
MGSSPNANSSGTASVGTANRFSFQGTGTTFTLQYNNAASTFRLPVALNSLTSSGTTVTATTAQPHGLAVGSQVNIMGASDEAYNGGPFVVTTVPSSTTFTYAAGSAPGTSPDTGSSLRVIGAAATVSGTAAWASADPRINLLQRTLSLDVVEQFDPDGASTTLVPVLDKPSPKRDVTTYFLRAQKFWNGETVYVDGSGNACGISDGPPTNPPTVTLQLTSNCANAAANADPANKATFSWGGGALNGAGGCRGFQSRVPLIACDQLSPPQFDAIGPFLNNQLPLDASGSIVGYTESTDGLGTRLTPASPGGVMASSNTPLAQSVNDIRGKFADLWTNGQATPTLDPIMNHVSPKEKTVVIMVTDGMQNCPPFVQDNNTQIGQAPYNPTTMSKTDAGALGTAAATQKLYDPAANGTASGASVNADGTISGDAASSVITYVVGFGLQPTDKPRLDVIAWGGSGMRQTLGTYSGQDTWTRFPTAGERAQCQTCTDAFLAPDPDTLRRVLQGVIDVGAQSGEFSAQQTITESVFEYVDRVASHSAAAPSTRFGAIVPTRFVSSFNLPGFRGQLKAYQNDGSGGTLQIWSAGDKLKTLVAYGAPNATSCVGGMCSCPTGRDPVVPASPLCTMSELGTHIKRRIYTTDHNGVYSFDPTSLMASGDSPFPASNRLPLWPPNTNVLAGSLDPALGLPPDNPSCFLVTPYANCQQQVFADLQEKYRACKGTNLPNACTANGDLQKLQAARAEARELILAFMAGAEPVVDSSGGLKRGSSGPANGALLYNARSWVLADSELATPAVVTPPSLSEPAVYVDEYKYYRDGAGTDRANDDTMIRHGFGLTKPDDDGKFGNGEDDTRTKLKPVMTVIYAPANDMLHAFRAGPCYSPSTTPANCVDGAPAESGGEELWGFIPFDQLGDLALRFLNNPQSRTNHVYMLARGVRFADIFVPGAITNVTVGSTTVPSMKGVWRRILFFGRGIGGKYVTALDVTAPGPYTTSAAATVPPIPLWNRGNPDTTTGKSRDAGGVVNGNVDDYNAYLAMGETWSMPTVALVTPNDFYVTPRRSRIEFVLFMGSGYGDPNAVTREGTTHYTLDALSGDVVAHKDVEDVAAANGLGHTKEEVGYTNAIVANSVSFNRSAFAGVAQNQFNVNPHPWSYFSTRVYFGDLYGRLWKILTANPNVVLPAADLGANQPVGTAVALMGENVNPDAPDPATTIPNIFVTTGADARAVGPFKNYSLLDTGEDTNFVFGSAVPGTDASAGVSTFPPVTPQFVRTFDQGDPEATCSFTTEAVFRGTIQPTSAVECSAEPVAGVCQGTLLQRVFFGGTRLSAPATKFAPPTPLACGTGQYPCRSQFDSILYALGVETGQAAYDLSTTGDDAYRIFRDSRIAAIGFQADPGTGGGSRLVADEGLIKGTPKPPPVPGVPPTTTSATASVVLRREPGQPAPVVQYGSTVCQ